MQGNLSILLRSEICVGLIGCCWLLTSVVVQTATKDRQQRWWKRTIMRWRQTSGTTAPHTISRCINATATIIRPPHFITHSAIWCQTRCRPSSSRPSRTTVSVARDNQRPSAQTRCQTCGKRSEIRPEPIDSLLPPWMDTFSADVLLRM